MNIRPPKPKPCAPQPTLGDMKKGDCGTFVNSAGRGPFIRGMTSNLSSSRYGPCRKRVMYMDLSDGTYQPGDPDEPVILQPDAYVEGLK